MPPQIKQAKLREESRKKFGQFYVSVDDKTNAIRIVDLEGGIAVNGEDGTKIRCVASTDIEDYWLAKISQAKLETLEAIIKEVEGMPSLEMMGNNRDTQEFNGAEYIKRADLLTKLQAELEIIKKEQ